MDNVLTFENVLKMFDALTYSKPYKVWIDEATPEECEYYREYFQKYPNKGNYESFYESVLKKHACILYTDWEYETPTTFLTVKEFYEAYKHEKLLDNEFYQI